VWFVLANSKSAVSFVHAVKQSRKEIMPRAIAKRIRPRPFSNAPRAGFNAIFPFGLLEVECSLLTVHILSV
jgi:hypothetical protein